nr:response regulator [Butyrivibrio sp.]
CIALTANAGQGAKDDYLKAGFDDYLAKPINSNQLEEMIRQYLPEDKVIEGSGIENNEESKNSTGEGSQDTEISEEDVLYKIQGVDINEAVKNCGNTDILRDVVKGFYISIDTESENIEKFAGEKDFRNYTVAVHALKSSARLIGAMELSNMAAYLEQCGNDENDSEIQNRTAELLKLYRSYKDNLSIAVEDEKKNEDLPEIAGDELLQAFSDMKELIEAYDYDTADGILNMLSEYSIPSDYKDKFDKVKELMVAVDRDALLTIL